ncbi:MAG: hypothetical protein AAGA56_08080 [Myxococcota bacterium]
MSRAAYLSFVLAACGGSVSDRAGPPPSVSVPEIEVAGEAKRPDEGFLSLADMAIFEPDRPDQKLVLKADGTIVHRGETIGRLESTGELTVTKTKDVFRLAADGTVTGPNGELPMKIREDGSLTQDGEVLATIGDDGVIEPRKGGGKPLQIAGAAQGRRAAMFLTLLMTMPLRVEESSSGEPMAPPAATSSSPP